MILDLALGLAPVVVLALGLATVLGLALARPTRDRLPVAERRAAIVTIVIALGAVVRWWIVGRYLSVDLPLLTQGGVDSASRDPSLLLDSLRLDPLALLGLTAILGLGLLAVLATPSEGVFARRSFASILSLTLLSAIISISADLTSVATLWVGLALSLAAVSLGFSMEGAASAPSTTPLNPLTPMTDARVWLTQVMVGAPAFWVVSCALVAATGRSSLMYSRASLIAAGGVPGEIIVGLILLGAVVAGIAPFATRRLPHQRRPEIAFVLDGVFPVVGVLLAARAVALEAAPRPMVPEVLLVFIGLSGIASAVFRLRTTRGILEDGRIEGSIAFLVLAAPLPPAALASILIVGVGTLARGIDRLHLGDRIHWLRLPATLRLSGWPGGRLADSTRGRPSRSRTPSIDRRLSDLVLWLAESLADFARLAERRYDLAIGLLAALATVFIFHG